MRWNGSSLSPIWDQVDSHELYDHTEDIRGTPLWEAKDDFEDINVATHADPSLLAELGHKLRQAFGMGGWPVIQVDE